jgi:hypothetical protein
VTDLLEPDTDCLIGVRSTTIGEVMASATMPPVKQAVNLADLYRKAKAKGVLTSFTQYPLV